MSAGAAFAGPYVNVEANSGFTGSDYSGTTTDAHIGYAGDAGDVGYYVQAGPSIVANDGADTETVFSGKAGASVAATERLDEDYSKAVHQARVGYDTKVGALKPYIEGGFGVTYPEDGDQTNFTVLEVGTKVKITEKFGAYGKWENIFQDEDDTRDWKVEVGTKYKF